MNNPNTFLLWITQGWDIRLLNRGGVYLKHLNLRTIDRTLESSADGRPDYRWIHQNHPEWIVKDVTGNPIPLFAPSEEILDFGNDAYLDWVLNTWMPNHFFDSTDRDPDGVYWYLHDEGSFTGMYHLNCAVSDPICNKYKTDQGVQDAWIHMLDRFKAKYPNRNIVINTQPNTYQSVTTQMARFQKVLSHAAGYFSECLTNDYASWSTEPNSGKRTALVTTLQLANWLADNNKVFFPNLGLAHVTEPTQAATDYAWAFFNLMRKGDWQFFSKVTKDWRPVKYPEMDRPLGQPLEVAVEFSPGVYRRAFQQAITYVNISDNPIAINLPTDSIYQNSLGRTVNSPLTLGSFSGLTVYKSSTATPTSPPAPTNLTVR
jgi:hypothetical protein